MAFLKKEHMVTHLSKKKLFPKTHRGACWYFFAFKAFKALQFRICNWTPRIPSCFTFHIDPKKPGKIAKIYLIIYTSASIVHACLLLYVAVVTPPAFKYPNKCHLEDPKVKSKKCATPKSHFPLNSFRAVPK